MWYNFNTVPKTLIDILEPFFLEPRDQLTKENIKQTLIDQINASNFIFEEDEKKPFYVEFIADNNHYKYTW